MMDNVEYASSDASDITSPNESAGPETGRGIGGAARPRHPRVLDDQRGMVRVQSELHVLELPTANGETMGVNDGGEIVGAGWDGSREDGGFVGLYWAGYGVAPEPLLPLPNDTLTFATAINNNGVICGASGHQSVTNGTGVDSGGLWSGESMQLATSSARSNSPRQSLTGHGPSTTTTPMVGRLL